MNVLPKTSWLLTVDEYLIFEEQSDVRHEYVGGEVLSPSTTPTDRREKMIAYRRLPSVLCYLVIHQDKRLVEHHWRESADGRWEFAMVETNEIEIPGVDVRISVDQMYEGVELDSPA